MPRPKKVIPGTNKCSKNGKGVWTSPNGHVPIKLNPLFKKKKLLPVDKEYVNLKHIQRNFKQKNQITVFKKNEGKSPLKDKKDSIKHKKVFIEFTNVDYFQKPILYTLEIPNKLKYNGKIKVTLYKNDTPGEWLEKYNLRKYIKKIIFLPRNIQQILYRFKNDDAGRFYISNKTNKVILDKEKRVENRDSIYYGKKHPKKCKIKKVVTAPSIKYDKKLCFINRETDTVIRIWKSEWYRMASDEAKKWVPTSKNKYRSYVTLQQKLSYKNIKDLVKTSIKTEEKHSIKM